jgi:hypothetical protein
MPAKPLDRLMFIQGERCFFCKQPLPWAEASVEHLLATANGGNNMEENCVACCKTVNRLLGSMALKDKFQVVLNQKGQFKCPDKTTAVTTVTLAQVLFNITSDSDKYAWIVSHLKKLHQGMRPRTLKALNNTMMTNFPDQISEAERMAILHQLKSAGQIIVEGKKIHYVL